MKKVAVIGAGLSGLVVARRLAPLAEVVLYEKSRGLGGRMATRYAGEFEFDHGAQFFTARSREFRAFIQPLIDSGTVREWRANFARYDRTRMLNLRPWRDGTPRYVGVPRMNSVGKALSAGLTISLGTTITRVERSREGWVLSHENGAESGPFDWLVLTCPSAQTALLARDHPTLSSFCDRRRMQACFALMLGFAGRIDIDWDAAEIHNADVRLIAVNSSKPGRSEPFTMVVHSSNNWADAHIDDIAEAVSDHLIDEASSITGQDLRRAAHQQLHRWRYASIGELPGPPYFLDDDARLAACGDWCVRGRIEAAFTSSSGLADALVERTANRQT
jgi:predicted NAD/FAD-dependent oxidoreductase